jgi:hypothetical protein
MRGGAREPLPRAELLAKFRANAQYGGWSDSQADRLAQYCEGLFAAPDLSGLAAFRV